MPELPPEVDATKRAVLAALDEVLDRRMEPFLQRTQKLLIDSVEQIVQRHTEPFLAQMRRAALESLHQARTEELEPLLEKTKAAVMAGVDEAVRRHTGPLLAEVKNTAVEVIGEKVPEYSRRVGKRVVAYGVVATLFCLAAVFLFLGGILGLERAGVPPFASYLAMGSLAALIGLVILKLRSRAFEKTLAGC